MDSTAGSREYLGTCAGSGFDRVGDRTVAAVTIDAASSEPQLEGSGWRCGMDLTAGKVDLTAETRGVEVVIYQ